MKSVEYICITEEAAKVLIADRELQSIDFEKSKHLLDMFFYENNPIDVSKLGVRLSAPKGGYILTAPKELFSLEKNTLTVDLDAFDIGEISPALALTAIQKLLRFSIKYWGKLILNNNEYLPPNSTKAIVFPFPITSGSSYRITIEREPGGKRASKRYLGKQLLAYKFGTHTGNGIKEECSFTNFNKAIDVVFSQEPYGYLPDAEELLNNKSFFSTDLSVERLQTNSIIGQDHPLERLSAKQLEFVKKSHLEPARIEGPAGSGKTICMVLKGLYCLKEAISVKDDAKFLFICPSQEMVKNVTYFMDVLSGSFSLTPLDLNRIEIRTLHDVCAGFLKDDIHESELLDTDSYESKNIQLLHLVELVEEIRPTIDEHKEFVSKALLESLSDVDSFRVAELIRHEISVVIKGRCGEEFESYITVQRPKYGLPIETNNDRRFVYDIFNSYSSILTSISMFDVDDVAISAVAKLDSPIWRRRRAREGYDAIFIDEVHLFNMNELSLIHFLTKKPTTAPISYAIDLSQALGDVAWNDTDFHSSVGIASDEQKTKLSAVFRCSPQITDLAFSITSHGANIFTNFDNPIQESSYIYNTPEEESTPKYFLVDSKWSLIDQTFKAAEKLKVDHNLKRHQIAIIFFDRIFFEEAVRFANESKKSIVAVTKRGDIDALHAAEKGSSYVVTLADYVGGLEFDAVILSGVDKGRIPSSAGINSVANKMFQNYIAHNRMYVAVTRARKYVWIIGEEIRGASDVLEYAIENKKADIVRQAYFQ